MTTTVSRRELTRWASEVSGGRISNLEKQCCTGAIYCQMIEAARPGVVDMRKVNLDADKNNALGNYKALQVALGKIGVESTSMDIQNLTNGQPQATMDLLQSLHQHLGGDPGLVCGMGEGLGGRPEVAGAVIDDDDVHGCFRVEGPDWVVAGSDSRAGAGTEAEVASGGGDRSGFGARAPGPSGPQTPRPPAWPKAPGAGPRPPWS